jgi:VCBS repeat protein
MNRTSLAAVGDFDGDGVVDLAVTNFNRDTVSVLRGEGDGTFAAASVLRLPGARRASAAPDSRADPRLPARARARVWRRPPHPARRACGGRAVVSAFRKPRIVDQLGAPMPVAA